MSWIRFAAILLAFPSASAVFAQDQAPAAPALCAEIVAQPIPHLRREILAANLLDRMQERAAARVSNFIVGRVPDIDTTRVVDSDVVSLGSGPDIFLPIYLYPRAKYFHLVDLLSGWGAGPDHVKEEIEARLKSLPFSPTVERSELTDYLKWRVRWEDPALGAQEKIFFLHQMDFRLMENLEKVAASFGAAGLGGVVITGIDASLEVRKFLLDRLQPGGSMYGEMLYADREGTLVSDVDRKILDELEKEFAVRDFGPGADLGFKFTPRRILVVPREHQ